MKARDLLAFLQQATPAELDAEVTVEVEVQRGPCTYIEASYGVIAFSTRSSDFGARLFFTFTVEGAE